MSYSIDRLIWQYRDKPNVRALITSVLVEFDNIGEAIDDLRTRLDIDIAEGVQLDLIGELTGQPRPNTVQIDDDDAFAFYDVDDAKGFSGIGQPNEGGQFVGVNGLIIGAMPDEEYRTLLRAGIFAAVGNSDLQHLIEYGQSVTGSDVTLTEGVGYVSMTVSRAISTTEANLIRETTPLAAGVRLGYISFITAGSEGFTMGSAEFPDVETTGGFDDVAGTGAAYSGAWAGLA